jgi:rhamnosyltransferase
MIKKLDNSSLVYQDDYPKVAVLLAAHSGIRWIPEQLESILAQDRVQVKIFVSVDPSNDGTYEYLESKSKENSHIVVLSYGMRFGGAAPNFFNLFVNVDFSCFDAVAFADQDDIWFNNKLIRACELLRSGICDIYSSNVIAFWSTGKKILIDKSQPQRLYDHFFEAAGPGCTYVFNSSVASIFQNFILEKRELLRDIALHDWLAYAFFRERGFIWFIDPVPSMLYRQHLGNQIGTNVGLQAYKKRLSLVRGRWYRQQVELIAGLVAPEVSVSLKKRVFLMVNFNQLRRRLRDRLFLLTLVITGMY